MIVQAGQVAAKQRFQIIPALSTLRNSETTGCPPVTESRPRSYGGLIPLPFNFSPALAPFTVGGLLCPVIRTILPVQAEQWFQLGIYEGVDLGRIGFPHIHDEHEHAP